MHSHRQRVLCLLSSLLVLGAPPGNASPVWEDRTHNLRETQLTTVAVDPHDPTHVYAGSVRAVYRTTDGGRRWTEVLRLHGASTAVHRLAIHTANPHTVYAATEQGLYATTDDGRHWTVFFRGMNNGERACQALRLSPTQPGELWLGTRGGLFRSRDAGASWQREDSVLSHAGIIDIIGDPHAAGTRYVLADRGCYKTVDGGQTWDRLLVQAIVDSDDPDDLNDLIDEATAEVDPDAPSLFTHALTTIALDPQQPNHVYLGSRRGLYASEDGGVTWQRAPTTGLLADRIDDVLVTHASPTAVYAATPLGVFQYDPARKAWQPLNQGLTARRTQALGFETTQRTLWAAATGGLFALDLSAGAAPLQSGLLADDILMTFRQEPTIQQVQETAIRYAEVHPDKIARWRRAAYAQALLPTLSIGGDFDRNTDDHFDEGTFPKFQIAQTHDSSLGWNVGLSWHLGELLWNNDQTSIDSRSRLTTQLRNDILDQINRFYYERRRLQSAMALEPAADMRASVEQELHLQELTAQLDALTGGWFSRALEGGGK